MDTFVCMYVHSVQSGIMNIQWSPCLTVNRGVFKWVCQGKVGIGFLFNNIPNITFLKELDSVSPEQGLLSAIVQTQLHRESF